MIPPKPPLYEVESRVTYLEMRNCPSYDLPSALGDDGGNGVVYAKGITTEYYRYLYNGVGTDWDWYDRRFLDDTSLSDCILKAGIEIHVLMADGVPAGFVEFDTATEHQVEILYFGLLPLAIGRGLGSAFLKWAVLKAWSFSPDRVWLTTCDLDHPRAIGNYKAAGFQVTREISELRLTRHDPESHRPQTA